MSHGCAFKLSPPPSVSARSRLLLSGVLVAVLIFGFSGLPRHVNAETVVENTPPDNSWLCVVSRASLQIIKSGAISKDECITAFFEFIKGESDYCQPYTLHDQSPEGYYTWDFFGYNYGLIYFFRSANFQCAWYEVYALTSGPSISYRIVLSNASAQIPANLLAEIEPNQSTNTLYVKVYDNQERLISNVGVELAVEVATGSGGHLHDNGRNTTQMGKLDSPQGTASLNGKVLTGITDANGLAFTFTAPAASGDHNITAKCTDRTCNQEGPNQLWVGYRNFQQLSAYEDYFLVGETSTHPSNHYLTTTAMYRISLLASLWNRTLTSVFPEYVFLLHLNDASLERGGVFDISSNWRSPHLEHCRGAAIDIRANDAPGAIPGGLRRLFERLARTIGADPYWEIPEDSDGNDRWDLRHYHVRLLGPEGLQCP